jgi:hypothetical protein
VNEPIDRLIQLAKVQGKKQEEANWRAGPTGPREVVAAVPPRQMIDKQPSLPFFAVWHAESPRTESGRQSPHSKKSRPTHNGGLATLKSPDESRIVGGSVNRPQRCSRSQRQDAGVKPWPCCRRWLRVKRWVNQLWTSNVGRNWLHVGMAVQLSPQHSKAGCRTVNRPTVISNVCLPIP